MTPLSLRLQWCLVALGSMPSIATGQATMQAANGPISVIPHDGGGLSFDFTESKLTGSIGWSTPILPHRPSSTMWLVSISGAAQKGRRDIFAGGSLSPAASLELLYTRRIESTMGSTRSGFWALSASVLAAVERQKYASISDGLVTAYGVRTAQHYEARVGVNRAISQDNILGLSLSGGRRINSLAGSEERQFCRRVAFAESGGGDVFVEECDSRFVGQANNSYAGQLRLDWILKVVTPGAPAARNHPTVGILTAIATDFKEGVATRYNAALGPTLHPTGEPSSLYAAVLLEVADIGNQSAKDIGERVSLRVYARVPF